MTREEGVSRLPTITSPYGLCTKRLRLKQVRAFQPLETRPSPHVHCSKYARNSCALCCVVSRTLHIDVPASSACLQACLAIACSPGSYLLLCVYMCECISSGTEKNY
ncbi:hypothetical protein MTO96_021853 [Rhipicephalus appendiculatus]